MKRVKESSLPAPGSWGYTRLPMYSPEKSHRASAVVSKYPQPCTDTHAPLGMLSSMFLSWEQADTSPAGDSPVLSCGHSQLPTHNTELLQPLSECWFYSPKPLAALRSLAGGGLPSRRKVEDRPQPLLSLQLEAAGTSMSTLLCCCHPLAPCDTSSPGINGEHWGGMRAVASGSISTEVIVVPSGTGLPKSGAEEEVLLGGGGGGMVQHAGVPWAAGTHPWHVLAQPQFNKPSLISSGSDMGLTLSAASTQ